MSPDPVTPNEGDENAPSEGAPASSNAPAGSADAAANQGEVEPAAPEPSAESAEAASATAEAGEPGSASDEPGEETHAEAEDEAATGGDDAGPPSEATAQGGEGKAKKKRRRRKKKKGGEASGKEAPARPAPRPRSMERPPFQVGEEVFGKVTAVLETAVMVDLSGKALAIFDRSEMEADDLVPSPADRFVARVHNDGGRGGLVVLTRKPLREEEIKPKVEQAAKDSTLVSGLITGVIKGGVEVDIYGLRAFAPASGMDLHPAQANFTALLGQRMDFKVVQYAQHGRDVVVTRRPMLEAEAHERRKHALGLLQEGQVMRGVVRTVVEWGAFVALPDAENLEGLVHISEASHEPRARLADLVKPGDEFEVKITRIDEKGKIWLSRKALIADPWAEAREKYAPGSRHSGKVTRLEKFGAFIELETGIEGLLHVADLSLTRIEHPKDVLQDGQDLEVVIHQFDPRTKKIMVHPAPPPERANEPRQKVARNASVKVEVVKPESAGVVVRLLGVTGRSARGFIPAGQTGTARGTDLRKAFKPGSMLDVKIIDVDPRNGEPKLSVRGFKEDEERRAHKEYRQKLKAEGGFGTLGDLLKNKLGISAGSNEPGR